MLLPEDAIARFRSRFWENRGNLRARLSGEKSFPVRLRLRPDRPGSEPESIEAFHRFQQAWRLLPERWVEWRRVTFRDAGEQDVPVALVAHSMSDMAELLGADAVAELNRWHAIMAPAVENDPGSRAHLVAFIPFSRDITPDVMRTAVHAVSQLYPGAGSGYYTRGIPLEGVDTKFLENYDRLVVALLPPASQEAVAAAGSLIAWLGARTAPSNWITLRPLSPDLAAGLGGFPVLQVPAESLKDLSVQPQRLLVIENLQSLYIPESIPGTLAIGGCGRNLAWLGECPWLSDIPVGYWGDIDSWGFTLLSEARGYVPHLESLMMDGSTFNRFMSRGVSEPSSATSEPPNLTDDEAKLYRALLTGSAAQNRLEQERLDADYVLAALRRWSGDPGSPERA